MVLTLLDVFVSVNVPVPIIASPLPVMAAACVTRPVAFSETLLDAAAIAAATVMSLA